MKETKKQVAKVKKSQEKMQENVELVRLTEEELDDFWERVLARTSDASEPESDTEPTVNVNVLPPDSNQKDRVCPAVRYSIVAHP